jgi:hypothetical protein
VDEQRELARLRLLYDFNQSRLVVLRGRIDQADLAPALLDLSKVGFQVVDRPREETSPRGGTKPAATIAGVALGAGLALAALLTLLGTLLTNHIADPADVARLAPARLFATVPRVVIAKSAKRDLRASLAAIAFANGDGTEPERSYRGRLHADR